MLTSFFAFNRYNSSQWGTKQIHFLRSHPQISANFSLIERKKLTNFEQFFDDVGF